MNTLYRSQGRGDFDQAGRRAAGDGKDDRRILRREDRRRGVVDENLVLGEGCAEARAEDRHRRSDRAFRWREGDQCKVVWIALPDRQEISHRIVLVEGDIPRRIHLRRQPPQAVVEVALLGVGEGGDKKYDQNQR